MPAQKRPANTARTENVSVRLDPKVYYLASIAAREHQSGSLSGFIEWALKRTMRDAAAMQNEPMPGSWPAEPLPLWGESLWDVDEADRFYNLATIKPGLLTVAEQRLWKLFNMHIEQTGGKISLEAFREFWNQPAIDTEHLKGGK